MARPRAVYGAARLRPGDPTALARCRGDPPVKAAGQFQRDLRAAQFGSEKETCMIACCLFGQHADGHFYALLTQKFEPLPGHTRIAILKGTNDAGNARRHQRPGAGRRLPVMGARFQRHIGRGPACQIASLRQGADLAMRTPTRGCPATPDNTTLADNDTANGWVGPTPALPSSAQ